MSDDPTSPDPTSPDPTGDEQDGTAYDGLRLPALLELPGLARVAAGAGWHTAQWGVKTSVRTGWRLARAIGDPDEAGALARDATQAVATVGAVARAVTSGTPLPRALVEAGEALAELAHTPQTRPPTRSSQSPGSRHEHDASPAGLRRRGAALLERSRDVWDDEQAHPAYERILSELAPDEARVLLLLLEKGPQPSVDVRTGGPIGMVNSQLIAPGLSMIGARAGCRHLDQVPSYLNNLIRLGLVWFSRESLRDPMPYQVVEAQPDVLAALRSVKFGKIVRRSIHLTPFGEDFCQTCLVEDDAVVTVFPQHGSPPTAEVATDQA